MKASVELGCFVAVGILVALIVGGVAYRQQCSTSAIVAGLGAGALACVILVEFRPVPGWMGIVVLPVVVAVDVMVVALMKSRLVVAFRLGVLTGLSTLAVRLGCEPVAGILDNGPEDEVAYAVLSIVLLFVLGMVGLALCLRYLSNLLQPASGRVLRVLVMWISSSPCLCCWPRASVPRLSTCCRVGTGSRSYCC